jgi:hypothetical protein
MDNIFPDRSNTPFDIKYNQLKILASDLRARGFNSGQVTSTPVGSPQTGDSGGDDTPPPGDSGCRKIYVANLTQSVTNDPVATVFENTIGPVVWTRQSTGIYRGTLVSGFPLNATWVMINKKPVFSDDTFRSAFYVTGSADYVEVRTEDASGPSLTDSILSNMSIEIRTYCDVVAICVPVAIGLASLPDAFADVPYNYSIPLGGTGPFTLGTITKPSWMTIAIDGTDIVFSGTPASGDIGTGISVSVEIDNCTIDSDTFTDSIDIVGPEPAEILYHMDRQNEDETAEFTIGFTSSAQTGTVDWGDGSPPEPFNTGGATSIVLSHAYPVSGPYLLRFSIDNPALLNVFSDQNISFSADPADGDYLAFGSSFTGLQAVAIRKGQFTAIPATPAIESITIEDMSLLTGTLDLSSVTQQQLNLSNVPFTGTSSIPLSLLELQIINCSDLVQLPVIPNNVTRVAIFTCPAFTGFVSGVMSSSIEQFTLFSLPLFNQAITLPSAGSFFRLEYLTLTALTNANMPNIPSTVTLLSVSGCSLITNLGDPIPDFCQYSDISNNAIDTINFGALTDCFTMIAVGNKLSSAQCDNLYSLLVAAGNSNGSVSSLGQTPSAPLSGAGLADEATLNGRGWTTAHD